MNVQLLDKRRFDINKDTTLKHISIIIDCLNKATKVNFNNNTFKGVFQDVEIDIKNDYFEVIFYDNGFELSISSSIMDKNQLIILE